MALTETQQIIQAWKHAEAPLITYRADPTHDGASSAVALAHLLEKMGKKATIVAPSPTSSELSFLPGIDRVKTDLGELQHFLLEVDVKSTPIKELSYNVRDGKLSIALVPKSGTWKPSDVNTRPGTYRFDLIITLGAPDLISLGAIFENHADFFYHTPIINIDHDPANEHYGQINCVDLTATSVAELICRIASEHDASCITQGAATCLLAGMIGKTRSFKTSNVTPHTLAAASDLVHRGGDRETIVHHFYRTRTVPILRLWGRALARLKHDQAHRFVWTALSHQDFVVAGAEPAALSGVIDELIVNAPDAKVTLMLYENVSPSETSVCGILHAEPPFSALQLTKEFGGIGSRETVTFQMPAKNLMEAEANAIEHIRSQLAPLVKHA